MINTNIFNHLDTSEQDMIFLTGYVENYLSKTSLSDLGDICESFPKINAMLYVDFNVFMGEIRIKEVTIQDNIHRIERERDSLVIKWILIDDVLPRINKDNKEAYNQAKEIRKDQMQLI